MLEILQPFDYDTWLGGSDDDVIERMRPFPTGDMEIKQSGEGLKSDGQFHQR